MQIAQPYFVRVYTMMDGTEREVSVRYPTYEQAEADLGKFNPSQCIVCGNGGDDLSLVRYASIEKRYGFPKSYDMVERPTGIIGLIEIDPHTPLELAKEI